MSKPMLLKGEPLKALLNTEFSGAPIDSRFPTKTRTFRPLSPQPRYSTGLFHSPVWLWRTSDYPFDSEVQLKRAIIENCPYGGPGDHIYVRETILRQMCEIQIGKLGGTGNIKYCIDLDEEEERRLMSKWWKKVPSIHAFKDESRIWLEVQKVSSQPIKLVPIREMVEAGFGLMPVSNVFDVHRRFVKFWNNQYEGDFSFDKNPWVWNIEIKRIPVPEGNK